MLKYIMSLAVISVFILSGCTAPAPTEQERVQPLPFSSVVGLWKAEVETNAEDEESRWIFKIEEDGTINRMVHVLVGPVRLDEGGVTLEGPDEGTFADFVMGPCTVAYVPETRELTITVMLDLFVMQLPNGTIEGKSEDVLKGIVSEDSKTWDVNWYSYSMLEGGEAPDRESIEAEPIKLTFTKIDVEELKIAEEEAEQDSQ
jgi:hypothetical protein